MTTHHKVDKFIIYPTKEQALMLHRTFGCVCFVYNKMLAERIETTDTCQI